MCVCASTFYLSFGEMGFSRLHFIVQHVQTRSKLKKSDDWHSIYPGEGAVREREREIVRLSGIPGWYRMIVGN